MIGAVDLGVHVRGDYAVIDIELGRAAQRDVLTDGGDKAGHRFGDLLAFVGGVKQRLMVSRLQRKLRKRAGGLLEVGVAGDEVGFGIELDHRAFVDGHGDGDDAFGGGAVGLFRRLRQALGAQPIDGRFHIAVIGLQRLLAIHHADAGFFAQLFDERCGDFRHSPYS